LPEFIYARTAASAKATREQPLTDYSGFRKLKLPAAVKKGSAQEKMAGCESGGEHKSDKSEQP